MSRLIVIQFITVDGVVEDPDGAAGTALGGWAFRFGPEAVAGDKFRLGEVMETGAMLLGRKTWQHFARIWPSRTDAFSTSMNRMRKLVVSRSLDSVDEWRNSTLVRGDLLEEVARRKQDQDLVVVGSASVARTLIEHDLVDEYRLLVFPTVLGDGQRLFSEGTGRIDLQHVSTEQSGAATLIVYRRARALT